MRVHLGPASKVIKDSTGKLEIHGIYVVYQLEIFTMDQWRQLLQAIAPACRTPQTHAHPELQLLQLPGLVGHSQESPRVPAQAQRTFSKVWLA